ncbi:MAG: hypothetical protein GVY04_03555 [Cyanobacteria bacterium]|jgi:hypothetical protein|nr:hypothetical protein [Cyanobacteria bacterium GSL.Bin1]
MPNHQPSPKLIRRLSLSFQALLRAIYNFLRKVIFLFLRSRLQNKAKSKHKKNLLQNTPRLAKAGFVLPTTVLVLLVVALFAGALISRTGDRAEDVIRSRESERIDSIAAPAVERAKAKLEYIFNRDPRFPAGVPSESLVRDMMLYIDTSDLDLISDGSGGNEADPYTLPNETRIDLDGDGNDDNAWRYETDLDGDGTTEVVAYSILMNSGVDGNGDGDIESGDAADVGYWSSDSDKAANLITRTGPLSIRASEGVSSDCQIPTLEDEQGWFAVDATSVRNNFQVNVFVENKNQANKTVTALEFQQDRQLDKGNKFGVWFRYDLLIHPGPPFRLNGAIHTDGNLFTWNSDVNFYLVSSPDSCIYSEDANIIEITQIQEGDDVLFQGQAIANGTERVDLYDPNSPDTGNDFKPSNDSVKGTPNQNTGIYKYSLDPLVLFTEDQLVSRDNQKSDGSYDTSVRDPNWNTSNLSTRIRNDVSLKPYVDDLYRADDRWGPKPKYGKEENVTIAKLSNGFDENGDLIEASDSTDLNIDTLLGLNPPDEFPQEVGLDGYWERRAYTQGLRVIVGQRLELGNASNWTLAEDRNTDGDLYDSDEADPLYPIINNSSSRTYERRQLKTLQDNLAAVQATTVYHYQHEDGGFPLATLATTVHPGTEITVEDSTTFNQQNIGGTDFIITNFLEGQGTNGWEFEPPGSVDGDLVTTQADFADLIDIDTTTTPPTKTPLRLALENLAYFAGDPDGEFPPKQENGGNIVHPYPNLTMWGDYSNLRRALDSGEDFDDLSIADQTTIINAAANLGMLAYNIELEEAIYNEEIANLTSAVSNSEVNFGEAITKAVSGPNNKLIYEYITNDDILNDDRTDNDVLVSSANGSDKVKDPAAYAGGTPTEAELTEYFSLFTPEQYIQAFNLAPGGGTVNLSLLEEFAKAATGQTQPFPQIERDREFGFKPGLPSAGGNSQWNPVTGISENPAYYLTEDSTGLDIPIVTGCDPDIFDPVVVGSGGGLTEKKVGLALAACDESLGQSAPPLYPSLYYLFPVADHAHDGGLNARQPNEDYNNNGTLDTVDEIDIDGDGVFGGIDDLNGNGVQETGISEDLNGNGVLDAEPYIVDSYIFDRPSSDGVNWNFTYRVIADANGNEEEDGTEDSIGEIALPPKASVSDFVLPTASSGDFDINNQITDSSGGNTYVSLLDKGMYNGRQQMAVRHMNLDLALLKDDIAAGGEPWIPNSGIVYAFREDAIREDGIARPRATDWGSCNEDDKITDGDCAMDPTVPRDPPKNDENGVSAKPVDYATDPDRRPHAFRLANGADLGRDTTDRGLSFITDNPVAMLGDFNLHTKEEFTEKLNINNYNNFYSRSNLETGFARAGSDQWRPTEILSDAITILSNNYCDGVIENAIEGNDKGCGSGQTSSYRDTKLDPDNGKNWIRSIPGDDESPIKLDRDGKILYDDGGTIKQYDDLKGKNGKQGLNNASETTINTVFVSGLTPTREGESYGGLHNFPRFNENWGGTNLIISGSFVQLNFSTYDTASYDHEDTFESDPTPGNGEVIPYYRAPNRRWGYDVGLQYNPPGPIVERLLSQSGLRSEIYQEIEASDPYIQQLCKAATSNSQTCQ